MDHNGLSASGTQQFHSGSFSLLRQCDDDSSTIPLFCFGAKYAQSVASPSLIAPRTHEPAQIPACQWTIRWLAFGISGFACSTRTVCTRHAKSSLSTVSVLCMHVGVPQSVAECAIEIRDEM